MKKAACVPVPADIMGLAPNTVHLAVRGEPVEPPATHPEPFDKLRANGGLLSEQQWGSPTNTVDAPVEGIVLDANEASAANQFMLFNLQESTGFANDVLTRVEEDVWNGT